MVTVHYRPEGYLLELPGGELLVRGELESNGDLLAELGGARVRATVVRSGDLVTIMTQGRQHTLTSYDPYAPGGDGEVGEGSLAAPMPGKVVAVLVQQGERVEKGRPLMILEAMKMEHTITAPREGVVATLNFGVGSLVREGAELLALSAEEGS
jgi:3-methylcrotonyl-CoA carboxylase alpha subunit